MPLIDTFRNFYNFMFVLQKLVGLKRVLSIRIEFDKGQKMYFIDFGFEGSFMFQLVHLLLKSNWNMIEEFSGDPRMLQSVFGLVSLTWLYCS